MQSYFGRMISTELPRIANSRLSPNTTSPNPPTLATGAHSDAIITTYICWVATLRGSRSMGKGSDGGASGSVMHFSRGVSGAKKVRTDSALAAPESDGGGLAASESNGGGRVFSAVTDPSQTISLLSFGAFVDSGLWIFSVISSFPTWSSLYPINNRLAPNRRMSDAPSGFPSKNCNWFPPSINDRRIARSDA